MKQVYEIDLTRGVVNAFNNSKGFLTNSVNALTQSAQPAKDSLTHTTRTAVNAVTTVTSDAVKTITATAQQAEVSLRETVEQTKDSLEQTLQTTGHLKNTTSEAIQTAINSSVSDWLLAHPVIFRLVRALLWATNHPILSLIILIIAVAIAWSLVKALGRLFEIVGLLIVQAPFKLGMVLITVSSRILHKFGGLTFKQLGVTKNTELVLQPPSSESIYKAKKQRLTEILTRLEVIQKEQNELLEEVAAICTLAKNDCDL